MTRVLVEVGHVQQLDRVVKRHSERYFAVAFQRLNGKVFHNCLVDFQDMVLQFKGSISSKFPQKYTFLDIVPCFL